MDEKHRGYANNTLKICFLSCMENYINDAKKIFPIHDNNNNYINHVYFFVFEIDQNNTYI